MPAALDEMPLALSIVVPISLSSSPVRNTRVQALIHMINERRALAIHAIYPNTGSETFGVCTMSLYNEGSRETSDELNVTLFTVSGDDRGGALLPALNAGGGQIDLLGVGIQHKQSNKGQGVPLIITNPNAGIFWADTDTRTVTFTIIYQWVVQPFPAQVKALLMGQLLGEIKQAELQRTAGTEYYQIPRITQIGGDI